MWKQLFGRSKKKVDTLADQGRASFINPETSRSNRTRPIIKPDAKGRLKVLDFKFQDLQRYSPEQFISALISSSEDLSRAKNIYQEYVAEGYEVIIDPPEDTEAKRIIDDFIERIELGGGTFISLLKRFVYGCYVEGAFCGELIFDQNGVDAIDIVYVSPFTIDARTVPDDDYGEVTEYGQEIGFGVDRFRVLQSKINPVDTFIYSAANVQGDQAHGESQVIPSLFGVISIPDIIRDLMEITKGQAYPRGFASLDLPDDTDYTAEERQQLANQAADVIRQAMQGAPLGELNVAAVRVLYQIMGTMGKENLDGAEMIVDIIERRVIRALNVPSFAFGGKRQGQSLSDNEARYETYSFDKPVKAYQGLIGDSISRFFKVVLRHYGNTSDARLNVLGSNEELRRFLAEVLKLEAEAYSVYIKDGVLSPQEVRTETRQNTEQFKDLDPKLPEDAVRSAQTTPSLPQPQ
jgi:hypothetical protein